jgi:PAS domain S-box-containing protein
MANDIKAGLANEELKIESSKREVAETSLSAAKEIFQLLVEAVDDYAIFALDKDGYILTWNMGGQRLKGYSAQEVIGTHFSRFYLPDDIERRHPQYELEEAKKNGKYEEEGWRKRKDGTTFWANVVITSLKNSNGDVTGFAKVTRDLSQKKIAEDKLRESEQRFRLMIEGVKDYAIIMLDTKGYVTIWNEGAKRIKGYTASEIIGKHFTKFYPETDIMSGKPAFELREAIKNGAFEDTGWRVKKDGTTFWANVIITAVYDATGKHIGFSKVTRDLTERKNAEERLHKAYDSLELRVEERTTELAIAKDEAEEAVRARDEFLSIASHELKTPLTSMKLQAQVRKRNIERRNIEAFTFDKLTRMVNEDEKQINRLSRLVDDMLDISRLTSGKFTFELEETNLNALVYDILTRFAHQLEIAGTPVTVIATSQVVGVWDRYRIEQVVSNLITNAMKYGSRKPITIKLSLEKENALLEIKDNGIGIEIKDHDRIFQQYERAVSASSVSGLGLGLFIVKEIIETHDGSISVESEIGSGSTFKVLLPLKVDINNPRKKNIFHSGKSIQK